MKPLLSFFALIIFCLSTVHGQTADTPKTMPQFDLDTYQFAFLKKGSKWTPESTPETQKIQEGHMANINRMAQLGKLVAAGPMGDNGDIRGIFVFKAASLDEAKTLAADDPAIKAGRLALEWMTWMAPKGIGVKLNQAFRQDPQVKMTMAIHHFVVLKKGEKWTAQASPELQQMQLEHLWSIRRRLDDKTYLAAGPLAGSESLAGILVIAAATPEAARALAERDPLVKVKHLAVELHKWLVRGKRGLAVTNHSPRANNAIAPRAQMMDEDAAVSETGSAMRLEFSGAILPDVPRQNRHR